MKQRDEITFKSALNYIAKTELSEKYAIIKFEETDTMEPKGFKAFISEFSDVEEFIELAKKEYKKLANNIYSKNNSDLLKLPSLIRRSGYILDIDEQRYDYFCGRENELFKMNVIFHKIIKNNLLLIGESGVGKTKLVEEYALKNGLRNIFVVECGKLIGNSEYRGAFEQKVIDLLEYTKSYNLIIFFDEIHVLLNLGKSVGGISITDILKPYLLDENRVFIGATTTREAHYFIEDEAFKRRFSIVKVCEPNHEILKSIKRKFETDVLKRKLLNDEEFDFVVSELRAKMPNHYFPDKLIDFLDYSNSYLNMFPDSNINKLLGEYLDDQTSQLLDTQRA